MASLNKCAFIGNLGRDPESRTFQNGDMITNASIACSESWKDKTTGEKKEKTEWIPLVFSGGLAKVAADYLRKGSTIYVEGKFTTRKWQDKEGVDRYSTEVRVDNMQMLSKREGGDSAPQQRAAAPAPRAAAPAQQSMADDDSIPF
ncbi:MAG: single-stranded DNA-binding protein [Leptothrix sp. (in: b-proteobacteria)]